MTCSFFQCSLTVFHRGRQQKSGGRQWKSSGYFFHISASFQCRNITQKCNKTSCCIVAWSRQTFWSKLNLLLPLNESVLNNFKDFLEAYSLSKIRKIVLQYTLKCSQLISSSDNKKILLTTRNVWLDSGRYATKYYCILLKSKFMYQVHVGRHIQALCTTALRLPFRFTSLPGEASIYAELNPLSRSSQQRNSFLCLWFYKFPEREKNMLENKRKKKKMIMSWWIIAVLLQTASVCAFQNHPSKFGKFKKLVVKGEIFQKISFVSCVIWRHQNFTLKLSDL